MATKKYTYYVCFGIVKTKMTSKTRAWEIKATNYESAIRQAKHSAQSNYATDRKTATLFYEDGHVVGWCFRAEKDIIYVDRWVMEDIGILPRRK